MPPATAAQAGTAMPACVIVSPRRVVFVRVWSSRIKGMRRASKRCKLTLEAALRTAGAKTAAAATGAAMAFAPGLFAD